MDYLKRRFLSATSQLNLGWLKKQSPIDVLIPFQHLVSDEPVPYIEQLYAFKNSRQFENDLDFLLKHFDAISLADLIKHQKEQRPFSKKSFLLTFDDGLRQVTEIIKPILMRKGVPAVLFVVPGFVDNKQLFYDLKKGLALHKLYNSQTSSALLKQASVLFQQKITSASRFQEAVRSIDYHHKHLADGVINLLEIDINAFRREQRPFMTTEEIRGFINDGFSVGAHSMDHPLYSLISLSDQIQQTVDSVNWVSRSFNLSYKSFAFPHIDTGISRVFFQQVLDQQPPAVDVIFGNHTGMLEKRPCIWHRYIGENPALPAEAMVKAVLAYGWLRKQMKASFVKRKD